MLVETSKLVSDVGSDLSSAFMVTQAGIYIQVEQNKAIVNKYLACKVG